MWVTILAIILALAILYYFIYSPYKYWENKNVQHPPVSYLFGNFKDVILLRKSISQVASEIYDKYGDLPYVGFYKFQTPCLLLRDVELVKEVMIKSFNSFHDNDIYVDPVIDPYFANNPFASRGQVWKRGRSQTTPSFTMKRVREMYPLVEAVSKNLVEYLNTNAVGAPEGVSAKEFSLKYTTDAVISCALGLEANSFLNPNSEYLKMIKKILSPSLINSIKFTLVFNFPSLSKLFKTKVIPDDASAYFKNIINTTLQYRNNNNIQRGDFLDSMNEYQNKLGITIDDVTANVLTFFTDGTETSSIALSFSLYELSLHPDIQERVVNEIEEILQKYNGKINFDAIQEMKYLDNVLSESMRKNTTVPVFSKICTKQFTIQSSQNNGKPLIIEPGTPIIISTYSIHRDPKYHSEPWVFNPSRFSHEGASKQSTCTFMPFGDGPRICIGQIFGLLQIKTALVHILKNFEIKMHKSTIVPYRIDPLYFLLAAKDGIQLEFYKRQSTHFQS